MIFASRSLSLVLLSKVFAHLPGHRQQSEAYARGVAREDGHLAQGGRG